MTTPPSPSSAASASGDPASALAAVLDWWRDAGVDHAYADAPRPWLTEAIAAAPAAEQRAAAPRPMPAAPPPPPKERIAGLDALPGSLEAFRAWWLAEPSLDAGQTGGRVAPRGMAGAALMVLVDHPEEADGERLLAGSQGRLLDAMLSALGIADDQVYVAAALTRHTPMADWAALAELGLGVAVCHHVLLARPERLLVFGRHVLPLLGHDPTKSDESLRRFNHEGLTIPLLGAGGLATLAGRARGKAAFWQTLLEWTRA